MDLGGQSLLRCALYRATRRRSCRILARTFITQHTRDPPSGLQPPVGWVPTPYVTETVGGGWHTYDIFSRLLKSRIISLPSDVSSPLSASIVAQLLYLESESPSTPINLYINSPGGSVIAGLAIYDTMRYISCPVNTICIGQAASMGSLLLCAGGLQSDLSANSERSRKTGAASQAKRWITENAGVMVHQPSGGYSGQATDVVIHAREMVRVRRRLEAIYLTHLNGCVRRRRSALRADAVEDEMKARTPGKSDQEETRREIQVDDLGKQEKRAAAGMRLTEWTPEEIEKMMDRDYFMDAEEACNVGIVDEILVSRKQEGERESENQEDEDL